MAIATVIDDKLAELHAVDQRAILITVDPTCFWAFDEQLPETVFGTKFEAINHNGLKHLKCYIHGTAQDAAGYDIPNFRAGVIDLSLDEQPCTLILDDARCLNCTLHIWRTQETGYGCSFIVANDDEESAAYARKCRAEKRRNI